MKKLYTIVIAIFICITTFAQAPEKISYQVVLRDADNELLINTTVGIQFSILQGSDNGTPIYVETQTPNTNNNGLVNIEIGNGTSNDNFADIEWGTSPYFLKTEIDIDGGTNYTITGVSELLSVPYSLYSKSADTITGDIAETDPIFDISVASGITASDTTRWGEGGSFTEVDPVFDASVASGITATDTTYWNNKLDSYTETDPVFDTSVAGSITASDTTRWGETSTFTEVDPIFDASVASGITGTDTTNLNNLSGINTGDQDLSGYASTDSLAVHRIAININTAKTGVTAGTVVGQMQYWDGSAWIVVPVGQPGQFLQLTAANVPTWSGATYPGAPTIGTATGGNAQATLTYTAPASDGGSAITGYTATSSPGGITGTLSQSGSGTITITGLTNGTAYTFTVTATNAIGTSAASAASNSVTPTAPSWTCGDALVDARDSQTYNTVSIGTQCWMAENLNIGTRIDGVNNQTNNSTIEKYCYNDDVSNCDTYGGLYQWDEMMQYVTTGGVQGICPSGWHLPTDDEWKTLEMELGMSQSEADVEGWRGTDEGEKMKSTSGWANNGNGTNSSGFTGLPGGHRDGNGSIYYLVTYGFWWSSTETSGASTSAWYRYMHYAYDQVNRVVDGNTYGFSVRCIKD